MAARDGCNIAFFIGWYTNFILGIHIYLLAIAICGIMGCYGHLVIMLCLLSNLRDISFNTGGGPSKIYLRRKGFFVDCPLKRAEKASGPPHTSQNQEQASPCDCGEKQSCLRHVIMQ